MKMAMMAGSVGGETTTFTGELECEKSSGWKFDMN